MNNKKFLLTVINIKCTVFYCSSMLYCTNVDKWKIELGHLQNWVYHDQLSFPYFITVIRRQIIKNYGCRIFGNVSQLNFISMSFIWKIIQLASVKYLNLVCQSKVSNDIAMTIRIKWCFMWYSHDNYICDETNEKWPYNNK